MPLSPQIVVIGVVFILSIALLLILAFEERFDEKTTAELEQDLAYHTMLEELRQMQSPGSRFGPRPVRVTELSTQYQVEGGFQGT